MTIDKPPFDPNDLLAKLKGFVDEKGTKSGDSWTSKLFMITATLIGLAIWSWVSWRRNRELSRLRHAQNRIVIERDQALVIQADEALKARIERIQRDIDAADKKLSIIDADIRAEKGRYEADLRAVDSIRSWSDAGIR